MSSREQLLRLEVGRFRRRESRRVFDAAICVGRLAADRDSFVLRAQDLPCLDAALRLDVVTALLETAPTEWDCAWLVRPGTTEPHDLDGQWLAAANGAFGAHDRPLDGFYVITRTGWRDVRSGHGRTWVRLRV